MINFLYVSLWFARFLIAKNLLLQSIWSWKIIIFLILAMPMSIFSNSLLRDVVKSIGRAGVALVHLSNPMVIHNNFYSDLLFCINNTGTVTQVEIAIMEVNPKLELISWICTTHSTLIALLNLLLPTASSLSTSGRIMFRPLSIYFSWIYIVCYALFTLCVHTNCRSIHLKTSPFDQQQWLKFFC